MAEKTGPVPGQWLPKLFLWLAGLCYVATVVAILVRNGLPPSFLDYVAIMLGSLLNPLSYLCLALYLGLGGDPAAPAASPAGPAAPTNQAPGNPKTPESGKNVKS